MVKLAKENDICQLSKKLVIRWSRRHRGACLDVTHKLRSSGMGWTSRRQLVVGCGMVSLSCFFEEVHDRTRHCDAGP